MTRPEFENLYKGEIFHLTHYSKNGLPQRWKVNGKMQGSLKMEIARWPMIDAAVSQNEKRRQGGGKPLPFPD